MEISSLFPSSKQKKASRKARKAAALKERADALRMENKAERALEKYQDAATLFREACQCYPSAENKKDLGVCLYCLAGASFSFGNKVDAITYWEECLDCFTAAYERTGLVEDCCNVAIASHELSRAYYLMGEEAEKYKRPILSAIKHWNTITRETKQISYLQDACLSYSFMKAIYEDEADQEGVMRCERRILSLREAVYNQTQKIEDKAQVIAALDDLVVSSHAVQDTEGAKRYQKRLDALRRSGFQVIAGGKKG